MLVSQNEQLHSRTQNARLGYHGLISLLDGTLTTPDGEKGHGERIAEAKLLTMLPGQLARSLITILGKSDSGTLVFRIGMIGFGC